jgi:hypothetical protein
MVPDLDFNVITGALSALLFHAASPVTARIAGSSLKPEFEQNYVIAVQASLPVPDFLVPFEPPDRRFAVPSQRTDCRLGSACCIQHQRFSVGAPSGSNGRLGD